MLLTRSLITSINNVLLETQISGHCDCTYLIGYFGICINNSNAVKQGLIVIFLFESFIFQLRHIKG